MESILIHPANGDQLKAIKAVLEALKIPFEPNEKKAILKNHTKLTKAEIDQAYKEMRQGKYTVIRTADLWK